MHMWCLGPPAPTPVPHPHVLHHNRAANTLTHSRPLSSMQHTQTRRAARVSQKEKERPVLLPQNLGPLSVHWGWRGTRRAPLPALLQSLEEQA